MKVNTKLNRNTETLQLKRRFILACETISCRDTTAPSDQLNTGLSESSCTLPKLWIIGTFRSGTCPRSFSSTVTEVCRPSRIYRYKKVKRHMNLSNNLFKYTYLLTPSIECKCLNLYIHHTIWLGWCLTYNSHHRVLAICCVQHWNIKSRPV